jgi:uncharacterized repeat protein (TIGR02543 family)
MRRKVTIVVMVVLCFGLAATGWATVEDGKAYLFAGEALTQSNLLAANAEFGAAVDASPDDPEANFFYAYTRILALLGQSQIQSLLQSYGITITDDFQLDVTTDAGGDYDPPAGAPSPAQLQALADTMLMPEIDAALANLAKVPETFSVVLPRTLTNEENDIEADYGDVLVGDAFLKAGKALMQLLAAYDFDISDLDGLAEKVANRTLDIEADILAAYSDLLTLTPDASTRLASARSEAIAAIEAYLSASAFVRGETAVPGRDEIFEIDAEDLEDESVFRANLTTIKRSLAESTPVDVGDEEENLHLNVGEFLADPMDIRDYLPEIYQDPYTNEPILSTSTLPDKTFGGIFPEGAPLEGFRHTVVWGMWGNGWENAVALCQLDGIAPWEIDRLTVAEEDVIIADMAENLTFHHLYGHFYRGWLQAPLSEGSYSFELDLLDGETYEAEKNYTYNPLPVVDIYASGTSPAHQSYVNTTTPTLAWVPVSDERITTLYYRVTIFHWEYDEVVHESQGDSAASLSIPDGVLEPDTPYRWRVDVFDGETGVVANNRSLSDTAHFHTGAADAALAIDWAYLRHRTYRDGRQRMESGVGLKGPAPWDITEIRLSGPETDLQFDADSQSFRAYDAVFPDGAYTLRVTDGRPASAGIQASVTKNFTHNPLPSPGGVVSPGDQTVVTTDIPTFSWQAVSDDVDDSLYYRLELFGFDSEWSYVSELTSETSLTLPAGILMPDTAYECRVSVYDDSTGSSSSNRIKGPVQTFFVQETLTSTYNLNTSVQGQGSIDVSPEGSPYADGTVVTLTAIPAAGYIFAGWSGNASGTDTPLTLTMNGSKSITAIFTEKSDSGDSDDSGDSSDDGGGGGGGGGCFIDLLTRVN